MNDSLSQYYRCPSRYLSFELEGRLEGNNGYFRFGRDAVCYGRYHGRRPAESSAGPALHDASLDTTTREGTVYLPFDLTAVVDNLRWERYVADWHDQHASSFQVKMYYLIRSALPFSVRSYLKKLHLKGWETVAFPRWPVDCSVDNLLEHLLLLSLEATGAQRIPFIWFWPDGASSCAIMTHDVETKLGQQFCSTMMDIDDSFGIKASLQIIPEQQMCIRDRVSSIDRPGGACNLQILEEPGGVSMGTVEIYNNLFYGCSQNIAPLACPSKGCTSFTWGYNSYFGMPQQSRDSSAHVQVASSKSPFVAVGQSRNQNNFALISDTAAWTPLASPYNGDVLGLSLIHI